MSDSHRSIYASRFHSLLTYPAVHIATGLGILLLDYWTGPVLMFPILFVIPVVLSAWFCSARLAYALAVLLPVGRFFIATLEGFPETLLAIGVNTLVRVAVLSFLAFLVARTIRQQKEISVLHGLLPICMYCKRVRDEHESWQKLETYVAEHSEVNFSHGLCRDCAREHYGNVLDKKMDQLTPERSL